MKCILKTTAIGLAGLLVLAVAVLYKPLRGERYQALQQACWHGDTQKVRLLLALGADPDGVSDYKCQPAFEFSYPIDDAAWNNHAEIIKLLIDAGASVNVPDREMGSPLCTAAREGSLEAARVLLDAGAETITPGGDPIQAVANRFGHVQLALLIEKYAQSAGR